MTKNILTLLNSFLSNEGNFVDLTKSMKLFQTQVIKVHPIFLDSLKAHICHLASAFNKKDKR